jgi:hypothetical protein
MRTRNAKAIPLFFIALISPLMLSMAADGGRLLVSASENILLVGETAAMEVRVKGAPEIYGADVHLTFDPAILEVLGADGEASEPKLIPGEFIAFEKSFVLQNSVDNEAGTIDYALALLNPAPAVDGDGLLLSVLFLAKAEGETTIAISEGLYGTQTGDTIQPQLGSTKIQVVSSEQKQIMEQEGSRTTIVIGGAMVLLVLFIGMVVFWLLWRRSMKKSR